MRDLLPKSLLQLADNCPAPLYVVGGSVRDYLSGLPVDHADWDISSPCTDTELAEAAKRSGFTVRAVYPRTGTLKLQDTDSVAYEFTRFRYDSYETGVHAPAHVTFTRDIEKDAKRRDFKCNAVYFDITAGKIVDPLGGVADIEARRLTTVDHAEKVFGEDGLRLMRLARQAAQTGFSPDEECLAGAKTHAGLISDIAAERIFAELMLLLHADEKQGDAAAPYRGLCILRDTNVLEKILPELTLGAGMTQNARFHDHDVLEHSLRAVLYSNPSVRLAALLHDVGKPYCKINFGNYHGHEIEGARIAEDVLTRWKAPNAVKERVRLLVRLHMRDLDGMMREGKVRREIVLYRDFLDELFLVKQADYTACKDDPSPAPTVVKWKRIAAEMREEGVPFTLKELKINGLDVQSLGIPPHMTADILQRLLLDCALCGKHNEREYLLKKAARFAATKNLP